MINTSSEQARADALADAETLRLCDPYAGGITYLDEAEEAGRLFY